MTEHKQPTKEELEAENQRLLEEAEKDSQPTPSASPSVPSASASPEVPPAPSGSPEVPPTPSASPEVPEPEKQPKEPEKKEEPKTVPAEKFAASTREAQRLYKNSKHMTDAIAEALALPEPTDEELKSAFTQWDDMSDTEKELSKDSFINKRFRESVKQAAEANKAVQDWDDKVDTYADDPQTLIDNPELEGKVEEFKKFANDKTLVQPGTDFKLIVGSFLYEQSKVKKPKSNGPMFPTAGGGEKDTKPKNDKISVADAEVLKQTNYEKYKELLRANKIATE